MQMVLLLAQEVVVVEVVRMVLPILIHYYGEGIGMVILAIQTWQNWKQNIMKLPRLRILPR